MFERPVKGKWILGLLAVCLFTTGSAAADQTFEDAKKIVPGDKILSGKHIKEFEMQTQWGTMRVVRGKLDNRKTWNVFNIGGGETPWFDQIVLERDSLAVMHRFSPYYAIGKDFITATIRDAELSGSLSPLDGGDPLIINTTLDTAVIEEATLWMVLVSLPLEEGFRATVPGFGVSRSTRKFATRQIGIEVTGRETIKGGDSERYDCWVVDVSWPGIDFKETHWIADKPPYTIQKKTVSGGRERMSGFKSVTVKR